MANRNSETYYADQLGAAVERSHEGFERADLEHVETKREPQDARGEIESLLQQDLSRPVSQALSSMFSFISHFETFSKLSTSVHLTEKADTFLWGLLCLVIQVEEERAVVEVSNMLRLLGHKLELINVLRNQEVTIHQLKDAAVEVRMELLYHLTTQSNMAHRTELSRSESWNSLMRSFQTTCHNVDDLIHRIERLVSHAKQTLHTDELEKLRILLSLQQSNLDGEMKLPCIMLPRPKDALFYDRDGIIGRMDKYLEDNTEESFRSLALYGLGGVGKSHVALKYARGKTSDHDAVLWIHSETPASLSQSFSDIAVRLQLPGVEAQKHSENRAIVLNWLQGTKCRWLLVYDNAEDPNLLIDFWPPVASRGKAVITSRNHFLAFSPAETGIEVQPFDSDGGSKFILQLLQRDIATEVVSEELQSAKELSEKLDGHALAISQMTALIHRKLWSIDTFLVIYEKNAQKIHHLPGYTSLDAVWQVSFEQLDLVNAAILGVLAYIMPDSIPVALFRPKEAAVPESLSFCADEWSFSEALDNLIVTALVKRDDSVGVLSLHRLVQTQYRFFLDLRQRQQAFENAVNLLYEAFPQSNFAKTGQLYDRWAQCRLYSQHVLSLKDNFKKERGGAGSLKANVKFCKLLKHFARYLLEQAAYEDLEDVVTVANSAFATLEVEAQDPTIEAAIGTAAGLMWAHRGQFGRSEEILMKTYGIQCKSVCPEPSSYSTTELNLANVMTARGVYAEALNWQYKSIESARLAAQETHVAPRPGAVLCQNIGRTLVHLGRYQEAHVWLGYAVKEFRESQNGAMLAYTHFVLGSLYLKEAALTLAKEELSRAQNIWIESSHLVTHHFNGACKYKLGCIAADQGDYKMALEQLESSLVIGRLHQRVLIGDCARAIYKISKILRTYPERLAEAEQMHEEARLLVKRNWADFTIPDANRAEEAYDQLVYILWR